MEDRNKNAAADNTAAASTPQHSNPFENSRPVADEVEEAQEELENEQLFKEAQTERD